MELYGQEMKKESSSKKTIVVFAVILLLAAALWAWLRTIDFRKEIQLPVLMYHSVIDGGQSYSISPAELERHLAALKENGYTAVSFDDVKAYVNQRKKLPDKPIVISFDDGYENNFTEAYPVLKKYDMPATIFVIGKSLGRTVYTDGKPMTPHFSKAQAEEMTSEGLIDIQSHTFGLHQVEGRDPDPIRKGVLKKDVESATEYYDLLKKDNELWTEALGFAPTVLSYPEGLFDDLSEESFKKLGIEITCTSEYKMNTIVQGLPESLRTLGRVDADGISAEELIAALNGFQTDKSN